MRSQLVVLGEPSAQEIEQFARAIENATQVEGIRREGNALTLNTDKDKVDRATIHRLAEATNFDVWIKAPEVLPIRLFVADMEATIIQDEMLDILADQRGVGDEVALITARAMAGEIDFVQSLIERTRLLAGTPAAQLEDLCGRIRYTPGAQVLLTELRKRSVKSVLVTGGYGVFARAVVGDCGFDEVVANAPVLSGGVMTGELEHPICGAETKRNVLLEQCEQLGIDPSAACCIGDGANDVLMLQTCGFPASYAGKPVVREVVDLNITQGDLSTLLQALDAHNPEVVQA